MIFPKIVIDRAKPLQDMSDKKPYAPSADRNREVILAALTDELTDTDHVFEFGSGTGQHLCHFAANRTGNIWQPSDLAARIPGINQWIAESGCLNILPPIELDLNSELPISAHATMCYSANTLHIVSWPLVERLFMHAAALLPTGGKLCLYGPCKFDGKYTSEGNRAFDQQLRSENPNSGIREFNDLQALATRHRFSHKSTLDMPANNQFFVWERIGT